MTPLSEQKPIRVIVGLGNPGPEYAHTYHNVGILALDALAYALEERGGETPTFSHYKNLFAHANVGGLTLIKPLVYMNESGAAVKEALKMFHATAEELAVLHDDSDLRVGEMKFVRGGRAAGHKGIQSIIDHLHADDFARARIGIRDPREMSRKKAGDFVLSPISPADEEAFGKIFARITDALAETGR